MEILIWQERLHLLRKGKFLPLTAFEATSSRHSKRFNSKIFIALHESGQCISSCLHEIMCLIWGHPQYHVASFKLRLFFICCKSIAEQKQLIMANKMWSRAKNIFKQTNKQNTIGAVICVLRRTNSPVSLRAWNHVYEIAVWFEDPPNLPGQ